MSATGATKETVGQKLGLPAGSLMQEFGYDEDVDFDLRDALEDFLGTELLDEDDQEVVDGILLWWRAEDGDLVDGLMDVLATLDDGGVVWLLTPKNGREGHIPPVEIQEAAPLAGLHVTTSESLAQDWAAFRLVMKQGK
ncbi:DUF3052 domain-containing protein [Rothia nasimurium]|uniref:DUF3052 domain-containing protein n=1 Tax=Rothia nasimurium TaxID=85336 RepID=UPI003AF0F23C